MNLSSLRWLLQQLGIYVPLTLTVSNMFIFIARVEGESMQPTLNPDPKRKSSDYVLLNLWSCRNYQVKPGDVVAFKSPKHPNQKLIKRVIGLEGDCIKTLQTCKYSYIKVPKGYCWVEGDAHNRSLDSNQLGPIALGLITGKADYILWPPNRWTKLKHNLAESRKPVNDYFCLLYKYGNFFDYD